MAHSDVADPIPPKGGPVLEWLEELFDVQGQDDYLGEKVSMASHMLQAAMRAEAANAAPNVVAAALLHDVGHFTSPLGKACYEDGLDNNHEAWGAEHLSTHFPPSVTEPIRLHVEAKRYLCAVDAKYFSRLSPQSVLTLGLQGGKMSISEVAEFQVNPHKTGALFLRRCDEAAKAQSVKLKRFADYKPLLKDLLLH